MKLNAIIHKAEEGGFWAEVPALPGCFTQGETELEVVANLNEAIDLWLSVQNDNYKIENDSKILEVTV